GIGKHAGKINAIAGYAGDRLASDGVVDGLAAGAGNPFTLDITFGLHVALLMVKAAHTAPLHDSCVAIGRQRWPGQNAGAAAFRPVAGAPAVCWRPPPR